MSTKGVRKPKKPRAKTTDQPGSRRLQVDKNYKPPKNDTKRIWLEVWQDNELVAEGDLKDGWAEARNLLENPELEILEKNYQNKDAKYFYTWLVKADEGEQMWIVHFTRTSTDNCCYKNHIGFATVT